MTTAVPSRRDTRRGSHIGPERGRSTIHRHDLSHEDHDMMTQLLVGQHDADRDPGYAALPTEAPETALGGAS